MGERRRAVAGRFKREAIRELSSGEPTWPPPRRAMGLLTTASPCALVLVPLAYVSAIAAITSRCPRLYAISGGPHPNADEDHHESMSPLRPGTCAGRFRHERP